MLEILEELVSRKYNRGSTRGQMVDDILVLKQEIKRLAQGKTAWRDTVFKNPPLGRTHIMICQIVERFYFFYIVIFIQTLNQTLMGNHNI